MEESSKGYDRIFTWGIASLTSAHLSVTAGSEEEPIIHLYGKGMNLSYVSIDGERAFSAIDEVDEDGWKGPVVWKVGGRIRVEVRRDFHSTQKRPPYNPFPFSTPFSLQHRFRQV